MKERIKLEKANKTVDKSTKESQQKRKNQKDAVGQKKKKKAETDDQAKIDREKDKKVKEKEDKRKKKEEEQRRKDFLLEAKKAQAAERWSSTALDATNFTPEPLRRASNPTAMPHVPVQLTTPSEPSITAPHATPSQLTDPSSCRAPASHTIPPSSCRTPDSRTTPPLSCRIPASHKTRPASGATLSSSRRIPTSSHTPDQATPSPHTAKPPARRQATTPQTSVTSRCASDLRRGIHFMSPEDFSSDDEHSEESETDDSGGLTDEVGSFGSCCKEQNVEIEAMRKRLEKLHRRLNIACKSSSIVH